MRSFFIEQSPTATEYLPFTSEKVQSKDSHNLFKEYFGLRNKITQFKEKLSAAFQSEPNTWSSQKYIELLRSKNQQTVSNMLQVDFRSFADEFVAQKASVTYHYGPHGMKDGYQENMVQVAQAFLNTQEKKSLPTTRAKADLAVAQLVLRWMLTQPEPRSRLLTISPRGEKSEGYPGKDPGNYVFVNIFESTETGFLFRQYRSYDVNHHLPDLHQRLAIAGNCPLQSIKVDELALAGLNQNDISSDINIATHYLTPESEIELSALTDEIYQNKADWKISIDQDLPQFDEQKYQEHLQNILQLITECFNQLVIDYQTDDERAIALDELIATCKKSLRKWVETHAKNYEQTDDTFSLNFEHLKQVWLAETKQKIGQQLSTEEKSLVKRFTLSTALNPALPLNRLTSFAHCIVGTPASLTKFINNPQLLSAFKLQNLSALQLEQLIGKDRLKLWDPDGTCISCGSQGWVGECSLCITCELAADGFSSTGILDELSSTFSGSNKKEAQTLIKQLSKEVLKPSVSPVELLLNDVINPLAGQESSQELLKLVKRIKQSSNPIQELRLVVAEHSDQENSGKQFVIPPATQVTSVAA